MISLLDGTYGLVIKIALVVALCGGLYGGYRYKIHQAVQEAVQVVNVQHAAETFKQKEIIFDKAQKEKDKLQQDFDKAQKDKDAKIQNLNANVSTLLSRLSDRPSRDSSNSSGGTNSSTATSSTGNSGLGLYIEDSKFLVGEASRAEVIRLGLIQCYRDYDAVKKSVESFSDKK